MCAISCHRFIASFYFASISGIAPSAEDPRTPQKTPRALRQFVAKPSGHTGHIVLLLAYASVYLSQKKELREWLTLVCHVHLVES
jgi:hypothetical protein